MQRGQTMSGEMRDARASKGVTKEETHQPQLRKMDAISLSPNGLEVGESTYRAVGINSKSMVNVEHSSVLKDSPIQRSRRQSSDFCNDAGRSVNRYFNPLCDLCVLGLGTPGGPSFPNRKSLMEANAGWRRDRPHFRVRWMVPHGVARWRCREKVGDGGRRWAVMGGLRSRSICHNTDSECSGMLGS